MAKQVICFKMEESPYHPNRYTIMPVHENFYLGKTNGSYNVICARLLGLSYAQYLRFCRDICGAELSGKGSMYPIALFKNDAKFGQLLKLLNSRANLILWERANPNWREHQDQIIRLEMLLKDAEANV